jgi:hypothetical protein
LPTSGAGGSSLKKAFVSRKKPELSPEVDMPNQFVTKEELAKLINNEIRSQLGGAEGCSVSSRQIAHHTEDTSGCNWHVSGWFRSSRPSGDACEAIVRSASKKLQKRFNLKVELAPPGGPSRNE